MQYEAKPIDVTPSQLEEMCRDAIASDCPLFVWGDGGIGKSRILEKTIKAAELEYCDFRAMIRDLPDLLGYGVVTEMREGEPCPMTAPAGLPSPHSEKRWGIVFEELSASARMMQGALYGTILERQSLPKHNRVFATGNTSQSGGILNAMPKPLASRFTHVRLVCSPPDHLAHAYAEDWHPHVIAYHEMTKGEDWFNFDPKSPEETYACPRTWESVSQRLHVKPVRPDILTQTMAGKLGYGVGQKFSSFVRLADELAPTTKAMRESPLDCPIPNNAAAKWFLAATTAAAKEESQKDPAAFARWAIPFLCRLGDELAVFSMNVATRHTPQLGRTPEFANHFARNPRFAALAQFCK